MKKLFALLLAVIMVISMAACAPADTDDTTAGKADTTTAAKDNTTAAKDETTTAAVSTPWNDPKCFDLTGIVADNKINVGIPTNATVMSYEDNKLTKYMEELTGIEIEFTHFSSDSNERKQQLNLMIANQEKLPDVLYGIVDGTMASEYGQEGLLCDVTEFLENSPRVSAWREAMTDYEENYLWARLVDGTTGEIYFVPSFQRSTGADSQDWIVGISHTMAANVGLDAAEIDTIDEVYEYLTKTVKEDGNGNGKADEVGLVYRQGGYRSNGETWIINAYVYCMDDYIFNATDGEIWVPYNTDEYRQAMITMNKWYSEGLISPLSYSVKDDAEVKSLVDVGPGNYTIVAWAGHPTLITEAYTAGGVIALDYTFGNTLADETGKGGYANIRDTYSMGKSVVIPMNEEEPERMELAYLWCDTQYDWEVYLHWRYGEEGVNWEYIDGEALGLKDSNGEWAGRAILNDTWSTETTDTWHYAPIYGGATNEIAMGLKPGGNKFNTESFALGNRSAISYGSLWEKWEHEQPEELVYELIYTADEQEVVNEYKKLYKEYVMQARAQFVTGVLDPNDDAQWEKYLAELKANGEDELIEVAQEAYTRMNG